MKLIILGGFIYSKHFQGLVSPVDRGRGNKRRTEFVFP